MSSPATTYNDVLARAVRADGLVVTQHTRLLGVECVAVATLDSTNDWLARAIALGAVSRGDDGGGVWRALLADRQTAGRGRGGNRWQAGNDGHRGGHSRARNTPPPGLLLSLVLWPRRAVHDWPCLGLIAGVALACALNDVVGDSHAGDAADEQRAPVCLKWPNDLMIGRAKLAGILPQVAHGPDGQAGLVIGMGVNLWAAPTIAERETTALVDWLGPAPASAARAALERFAVVSRLVDHLRPMIDTWERSGFASARRAWLALSADVGKRVEVRLPAERFTGVMRGLDADGALLVELADGAIRHVSSGEVFS